MKKIIFTIIFSLSIGFVMGVKYRTEKHVCKVEKHAIGYTVISSDKVMTCCHEVVSYQWKQNIKQ